MQIYLFLLNNVTSMSSMVRSVLLIVFFAIGIVSFSQTYEEFVSKSADCIDSENFIGAEQSLIAAMKKEPANPGNFLLLTNLGTVQRKLGKNSEALVSYTAALSRYPHNIVVLQNRASLFCEMDSLSSAVSDYDLILAIDETNKEALSGRGLIYLSWKKFIEAEMDFEKILSVHPNDLSASSNLVLISKLREEWEIAEEKYTDLIYKYRTNANLYLQRAECYLRMKKLARASSDLLKAKELGCNDPMWSVVRGLLYIEQFDKHSAELEFLNAQKLGVNEDVITQYLKLCK